MAQPVDATKEDLIEYVAETQDMTKKAARDVVNSIVQWIAAGLEEGSKTRIAGLGTFYVVTRGPREAYNPAAGCKIEIDERNYIRFQPEAGLKNSVLCAPLA